MISPPLLNTIIKNPALPCLTFILANSCNFRNRCNDTAGYYKTDNSYTINDITYHPKHYNHYEEIEVASWYRIKDHDILTANGEVSNHHLISAAHKILSHHALFSSPTQKTEESLL
ncbi:hypothetical protein [Wolbachia endosymbiont of Litomosoides brasiliensis]|uniref:hypothetical protein n=1 Tax=Wolbachia endosymbiont of Litomosoides brasiliensis TaxID=1812117 RepID=UPI001FE46FAD|nr:hypothetical protein [Wolbachia endosymbiont of Litomosoides brasiliensis]